MRNNRRPSPLLFFLLPLDAEDKEKDQKGENSDDAKDPTHDGADGRLAGGC